MWNAHFKKLFLQHRKKMTDILCSFVWAKKIWSMKKEGSYLSSGFLYKRIHACYFLFVENIPAVILQDITWYSKILLTVNHLCENSFWEKVSTICATDGGICPDKKH